MRLTRLASAFVSILALTALPSGAQAGASFYVSDKSGMAYEEIPEFRKRDFDYVLSLTKGLKTEDRALIDRAGAEAKRWSYEFGDNGSVLLLRYSEAGTLNRIDRYDEEERMLSEEYFFEGRAYERKDYRYEGGRLVKAFLTGPASNVLYTDVYRYAMNGSLREIARTLADGSMSSAGADESGGKLVRTWHSEADAAVIRRYGSDGSLSMIESWSGGSPVSIESRMAEKAGKKDVITDLSRDALIERNYDSSGRLVKESSYEGKKLSSLTEYRYREDGKLEEKSLLSGGKRETVQYRYSDSGGLDTEEHFVEGALVKKVVVLSPDSTRTELYYEGELAVRYTMRGGRKVDEEILSGGEVVKRREFE
jgi:antitoxin component YwqK of YwqJK toxin-antitoxin module